MGKLRENDSIYYLYTHYCEPDVVSIDRNGLKYDKKVEWWKKNDPVTMLTRIERMIDFFKRSGDADGHRLRRCEQIKQQLEIIIAQS